MYTINIRGKQNPKDTKMVKLEIIFFKTGYARVPKVINITGLLKDWDVKSQSFRVGSAEATTKNKLLFDLRTKYLHVADTWEMEGRNWSPVQLSHCFDEIKAAKPEVKVKSVQTLYLFFQAIKRRYFRPIYIQFDHFSGKHITVNQTHYDFSIRLIHRRCVKCSLINRKTTSLI